MERPVDQVEKRKVFVDVEILEPSDWERGSIRAFIELPTKVRDIDAHIVELDLDRFHKNPIVFGTKHILGLPIGQGQCWSATDGSGIEALLHFVNHEQARDARNKLKTHELALVACVLLESDEGRAWKGELLWIGAIVKVDAANPTSEQLSDARLSSDGLRTLDQVTDDEIVDAIARHGLLGVDLDDVDAGNDIEDICISLGLLEEGLVDEDRRDEATLPFMDRVHEMCTGAEHARIGIPMSNRLMLTPWEWASRVAIASSDRESIAAMLRGESAGEWEAGVAESVRPDQSIKPSPY
jgi:hypothetical protein